ncbi:acetoacetate--CoA ligase [Euzebya rosea]|uniref:acetoacetate--CoA ligase n=1 Tax=Euzebya rosea TaxID=2052804 RepID=UPI000D3E569F|nr:acetoacetate--CoA ligase [Euzebya rosea]
MSHSPDVLWTPSTDRIDRANLTAFADDAPVDLPRGANGTVDDQALWRWSVDDLPGFWAHVWRWCGVIASEQPTTIMGDPAMPGTTWFEGARLNYAENLLRGDPDRLAVVSAAEGRETRRFTVGDLRRDVARVQASLVAMGVGSGDRVCGFVPNTVESLVAMLATTALGAIWSSTSPDFGAQGVVDRFAQVEPSVLVVADGYRYGGRTHGLQDKVADVVAALPGLAHLVVIDFAGVGLAVDGPAVHGWDDLLADGPDEPEFAQVPADHPLFVMYSSGTTGIPKSIVHGHGGTLVKHLVEHQLATDLHPGDTLMWFTTCGWMMWNWLVSALASEATIVLYDGSPTHPDAGMLWRLAAEEGVTHFGTSPKFLAANASLGLVPGQQADLSALQAVLSTGAPLNPEQFDWVYANVSDDVTLASVSGGTDIIGCFAGGVPTKPVRRGELQGLALGMKVEAWDDHGRPLPPGEKGELVCTLPFPSMPVGFWNDPDGTRYREAYFAEHPGVWTHGDFIELRPEGGVVIHGRSDTTLNPGGVRIGTAEIYRAIDPMGEVVDAIVVGRTHDGDVEVILCVVLADGVTLDEELIGRIRRTIRTTATPRHVPAHVFAVPDIPYTISGKKVEKAVRRVIEGDRVDNTDAMANPEALEAFRHLFD